MGLDKKDWAANGAPVWFKKGRDMFTKNFYVYRDASTWRWVITHEKKQIAKNTGFVMSKALEGQHLPTHYGLEWMYYDDFGPLQSMHKWKDFPEPLMVTTV